MRAPTYLEFFAGGGMVHAALDGRWRCLLANDFDAMKAASYRRNWPDAPFVEGDIAGIRPADVKGRPDLAWASFPCQDLSLAGNYRGIGAEADGKRTRSGTFWVFHSLMRSLAAEGRRPAVVCLENVAGLLTANGGADFPALVAAVAALGYRVGALVVDAALFVPQSRPRVFVLAVSDDVIVPGGMIQDGPDGLFHTKALVRAAAGLPSEAKSQWVWWRLPPPPPRHQQLRDLVVEDADWHPKVETDRLLAMMSAANLQKVARAQAAGDRQVGAVYIRTRVQEGVKRTRAEIRFDDTAGCLRTPSGGSSRQRIMVVDGENIRSRLLDPREAAALMGLRGYVLPDRYNDAYKVCGDGVAVPVVEHLSKHLMEPLALSRRRVGLQAAE